MMPILFLTLMWYKYVESQMTKLLLGMLPMKPFQYVV